MEYQELTEALAVQKGVELTAYLIDRYHMSCNIRRYLLPSLANRSEKRARGRSCYIRHGLKMCEFDRGGHS